MLVEEREWSENQERTRSNILSRFSFPFIAKPVDDGCSAAVKKIKNEKELIAFAGMIFRRADAHEKNAAAVLQLKANEEFPRKKSFMIETLIEKGTAKHFLEITGGLLTGMNDNGEISYEIFPASEALSEGDVLSLEEKFLAGEGQNITPARYSKSKKDAEQISQQVEKEFLKAAKVLNIEGYARIDAFVKIDENNRTEIIFIEVNSLPGMTPATCIFHQCALHGYKPYDFIDAILDYGKSRSKHQSAVGSWQ